MRCSLRVEPSRSSRASAHGWKSLQRTWEFERAAVLRDQIVAIEKVHEGQKVLQLTDENVDVIAACSAQPRRLGRGVLHQAGKLIGRENFLMHRADGDEPAEVLAAFVKQFYSANPYVPRRVLLQYLPEDLKAIESWLRAKRQAAVYLHVPQRGEKKKLVDMVAQNAAQGLEQLTIRRIHESTNNAKATEELQEALNLPRLPTRIECYDISNIQGRTLSEAWSYSRTASQEFRLSQVPDQESSRD